MILWYSTIWYYGTVILFFLFIKKVAGEGIFQNDLERMEEMIEFIEV